MELISYEQFGKLRLRDFVPEPTAIGETTDWEWMGSFWVNEGIGFTSFSRHVSTPQETGGLEVSFPELPPNAIERLLGAIGLPFRPGMSHDEVLSACGNPERTHVFVAHRKTYDFAIGSRHAYHVSATIDDTEGLVYVVVIRKDVLSKCDA